MLVYGALPAICGAREGEFMHAIRQILAMAVLVVSVCFGTLGAASAQSTRGRPAGKYCGAGTN